MVTMTTQIKRRLTDNLRRVRDRICAACEKAGRYPDNITLLAVTKTVEVDVIRHALDVGLVDLGESKVQDLTKRAGMIHEYLSRRRLASGGKPQLSPRWHMVGHLQRNKVKMFLPWVEVIHSLDSLRLAEEINVQAARASRRVKVLMQVNASGEKSKHGVAVGAATHLAEQIVSLPSLELIGLMTMAPILEASGSSRPIFTRLRELFEEIVGERIVGESFRHISMGMSQDYEDAILEGATIIRIGSALFEGLGHEEPQHTDD